MNHRGGEQRGGGLAIGAGHRDDRTRTSDAGRLPVVGQIELGGDTTTNPLRGPHHPVAFGNAGGRHDHCGRGDHRVEFDIVGSRAQFDTPGGQRRRLGRRRLIVDRDDVDVAVDQSANGRQAGRAGG